MRTSGKRCLKVCANPSNRAKASPEARELAMFAANSGGLIVAMLVSIFLMGLAIGVILWLT